MSKSATVFHNSVGKTRFEDNDPVIFYERYGGENSVGAASSSFFFGLSTTVFIHGLNDLSIKSSSSKAFTGPLANSVRL